MGHICGCSHGDEVLERALELGVPLDGLGHGIVAEFVREQDCTALGVVSEMRRWCKNGAYGVKGALLGSCDEGLVVGIDVCVGVASATSFPVKGVVSPHDVAEAEGFGDRTDTVVNVAMGRLSEKVRRRIRGQGDDTYAPAGRRDTDDEFNHLHLLRISNRRTKGGTAHTAKKKS